MKKLIDNSFMYAMLALVGGVFYREFTKWNGFTGRTTLAFVHPHLLMLGVLPLLLLALFSGFLPVQEGKRYQTFLKLHAVGLPFMVVMLLVRGIFQVLGTELSKGADAAIAGIAGISHIILGVSVVFFYLVLRDGLSNEITNNKR